jgi:hypothetical protein
MGCNTHDFTRKKFRFSTYKTLKYDTQAFYKRNLQLISIRLDKHNIQYVKKMISTARIL